MRKVLTFLFFPPGDRYHDPAAGIYFPIHCFGLYGKDVLTRFNTFFRLQAYEQTFGIIASGFRSVERPVAKSNLARLRFVA